MSDVQAFWKAENFFQFKGKHLFNIISDIFEEIQIHQLTFSAVTLWLPYLSLQEKSGDFSISARASTLKFIKII